MSNQDQCEDDLFGNDSESSDESQEEEQEEVSRNTKKKLNLSNYESDVEEGDTYDESDYFNEIENKEYKKATPFPVVKCPGDKTVDHYDQGFKKQVREDAPLPSYYQFKYVSEKLITLENREFEREGLDINMNNDLNLNAEYILSNYSISYSLKFDPSLSKYDTFSKKHHREKLYKIINEIDWDNEYKIRLLKKEINPYEDVFEEFFDRRSSYKIANLNSIFKFNLFNIDYMVGYTPIIVIGDDGGYADYIMWHAQLNDFTVKIFSVPERNNKIFKTNFRKEIDESKDELLNIVNLQKGCDIDEIGNFDGDRINSFVSEVMGKTEGIGVSLFIARKFCKFKQEFNSEIKYKKFLLLNVILGLSTLSKGGNIVIKIYDMYTQFTISVLFILFNHFEKFSVIKPFSTRPHSSSRLVVCQKLLEFKPKILTYLIELYDKYLDALQIGRDIDFVFPISKIIKDENFTNYMMEMNSLITEQRMGSLETIKNAFENENIPKFDKMDIKKKCLELWKIPVLHYDPRMIIQNKRNEDERRGSESKMNKICSVQDKDTLKIYSDYDKYSDGLKSMIDMLGGSLSQGAVPASVHKRNDYQHLFRMNSHEQYIENTLLQEEKNKLINKNNNNSVTDNGKKKASNTNKLDQLKLKIIADRKTESFLHSHLQESANDNTQSKAGVNDELLNRKREMLMSSFSQTTGKTSSKKPATDMKRNFKPLPSNKIKVLINEEEEKREITNSNNDSFSMAKEMLKRKDQAISESKRNRHLAENKKVVINDKLRVEIEKHKKK